MAMSARRRWAPEIGSWAGSWEEIGVIGTISGPVARGGKPGGVGGPRPSLAVRCSTGTGAVTRASSSARHRSIGEPSSTIRGDTVRGDSSYFCLEGPDLVVGGEDHDDGSGVHFVLHATASREAA
jgi:hypothetical protein